MTPDSQEFHQFANAFQKTIRQCWFDGDGRRIFDHAQLMRWWNASSETYGLKSIEDWQRVLKHLLDQQVNDKKDSSLPGWLANAYELIDTRIRGRVINGRSIEEESAIGSMLRGLIYAFSGCDQSLSAIVETSSDQFESGVSVQVELIDSDPFGSQTRAFLRPNDRYRLRTEADPHVHREWLYVMVLQGSADGSVVPIYPSIFDKKAPFLVPGVELLIPDLICDYELRAPKTPGRWRLRVITSPDSFDWSPDFIPGVTLMGSRGIDAGGDINERMNARTRSLRMTRERMERFPGLFSIADTTLEVSV